MRRYLYQLGPADQLVMYEPCAPHVEIKNDTCKLVVILSDQEKGGAAFVAASSHPRESVHRWMKARASINVFDFCGSPSCRSLNDVVNIQVIVRVASVDAVKGLRASGIDSVFVRPFFDGKEESEVHKVVPFPLDVDIAGALRQANRIPDHLGVVKTHKGFGVRVLSEKYDEAVGVVRPEDAATLLGKRFEVSGLPLYCGKDAITELLVTWSGAVPVSTFRSNRSRTWIVVAPEAPMNTKFQHGAGLAYIQPAKQSARPGRGTAPRFVPAETSKETPSWLKSWAGGVQPRAPCPSPPSQASARESQMDTTGPARVPTQIMLSPSQSGVGGQEQAAPSGSTPASASQAQDLSAVLSSLATTLSALDMKVTKLSTDVAHLQGSALRRESSPVLAMEDRMGTREQSRSRGRVPVGKRLFG